VHCEIFFKTQRQQAKLHETSLTSNPVADAIAHLKRSANVNQLEITMSTPALSTKNAAWSWLTISGIVGVLLVVGPRTAFATCYEGEWAYNGTVGWYCDEDQVCEGEKKVMLGFCCGNSVPCDPN
jgi:hypothetical protein